MERARLLDLLFPKTRSCYNRKIPDPRVILSGFPATIDLLGESSRV